MADIRQLAVPPHSIPSEQALLGSLLIAPGTYAQISRKVSAADFYRADHRTIYAAIAALHGERKDVDAVSVFEYLERTGASNDTEGLAYIARLVKDTPTAANIETHADAVLDRSTRRRLKAVGDNIVKASTGASGQTVAELVAEAQEQLQRLQSRARTGSGLVDSRQLMRDLGDDLDRRAEGPTGLRLGLPDFDDLTCGLEAGDLVVIAARPGMGKTALLVSTASRVSETVGAAVFSAEMPAQQLMRRCVALQADVPQGLLRRSERLREGDWEKIDRAAGAIGRKRLWIDDTGSPTLAHIRAETLALKSREPLGLVLVDYVQLVRGPGANRYEQLRDVAYGLKALAKELAAPIIILAQLNRSVESREQKRSSISDLRDSGAIEEAADIVGLLYSESYYDPAFSMPEVLECRIAKNRNGERGECLWRFEGAYSRVSPLDPDATARYRMLLNRAKKRPLDDL
jgi:replicative DNA helicase